jgi:serine/threonine protein kinase
VSIVLELSSLALRGSAHLGGELAGIGGAGGGAGEAVVKFLSQRFSDHSKRLTRALERSHERAWRAVEVAMAGNSWWERCQRVLTTTQERAFREQVQAFLKANPLDGADGFGPDFRAQCVAQLQAARKAGLFRQAPPPPDVLARHVGDLTRFSDPLAILQAERGSVGQVAAVLRQHGYNALATFLELRPASGPPVLAAAVRYFFHRELERDEELFRGLAYARLESLAEGQTAGFDSLAEALDKHGERLEGLLADVHSIVVQTRDDVLDMKAELQRQGQQMQELGNAVLRALQQHQLEKRALHSGDSLSVRDEDERRLVKDLVRRYRSLPPEERKQAPALLNAVGKLQVVAGDFESAERDFRAVADLVPQPGARAEAAHNAYLAALERRAWPEALTALKEAVQLDPTRFAPFPAEKFEAERILGAGGFGVAFLCRNTRSGGRVVIKTLRGEGLDRSLSDVFREAQALEEVDHPAIIRVRDCDYAGAEHSRPYLVMDYFPGQTLAEHVEQSGPLTVSDFLPLARLVAEGLQRAHERGILHRDVKPANLLVRRGGSSSATPGKAPAQGSPWEARLIDFGLALRAAKGASTMRASLDRTLAGSSIAGTIEYAAPEQMGKLKGVAVAPCSDVYGFGKTCCFALFGTPQPTFQHWQQIPRDLADLLGRCINEQPGARPQDFAVVLRELDHLQKPRAAAVPPVPKVQVMEAQAVDPPRARPDPPKPARSAPVRPEPVAEVLPVVEQKRQRPKPRQEEPEEAAAPPARRSSGGVFALLLLGVLVGLGGVGAGFFFLRTGGQQGRPGGVSGLLSGLTSGGPTEKTGTKPIGPKEFPAVLQTLQGKPDLPELRRIAERLAATQMTEEQKEQHARTSEACTMPGGPTGPALRRLQENDDVYRVSWALKPLLGKSATAADRKLAAQALQTWGTRDNVADLSACVRQAYEADVRYESARALAAIGDKDGIEAIASRLEDPWDSGKGIVPLLIKIGPKAELAVRDYLTSDRSCAVVGACQVLKEVGTRRSVAALKELMSEKPAYRNQARAALDAIYERMQ